jgi:hypothetical protein
MDANSRTDLIAMLSIGFQPYIISDGGPSELKKLAAVLLAPG